MCTLYCLDKVPAPFLCRNHIFSQMPPRVGVVGENYFFFGGGGWSPYIVEYNTGSIPAVYTASTRSIISGFTILWVYIRCTRSIVGASICAEKLSPMEEVVEELPAWKKASTRRKQWYKKTSMEISKKYNFHGRSVRTTYILTDRPI